jgi:hypothetical protein
MKGVLVQNREEHLKKEHVHRFSQGLCQRKKGPVDFFKGFQQDPEELFQLRRRMIQRPGGQWTLLR